MNRPIYYDGSNHYVFTQNNDGTYNKVMLANDGKTLTNNIVKYSNIEDVKKDAGQMFKSVPSESSIKRTIKNIDSTDKSIAKLQQLNQKRKDKLGEFQLGGYNTVQDDTNAPDPIMEHGGSIHIKPENKGKFTTSANQRGMGVQEFAHKVMANKDNYSPTMIKRANFAINATKFKHEDGGTLPTYQGKVGKSSYIFDPNLLMDDTRPITESDFKIESHGSDSEVHIGPDGKVSEFQIMPDGNIKSKPSLSNVNKFDFSKKPSTQFTTSNPKTVLPPNYDFNPNRLQTAGDRLQHAGNALVSGYNFAKMATDPGYVNPLIMPDFKMQRQFDQANMKPIVEGFNSARRDLSSNIRDTGQLLSNIQNLNATKVSKMVDEAVRAATQQRVYDKAFQTEQQGYEDLKAQELRRLEALKREDMAAKEQFGKESVEGLEKTMINKGQLLNAQLKKINEVNSYVNQLSPEYKVHYDQKHGRTYVIHLKDGKWEPAKYVPQDILNVMYSKGLNVNPTGTVTTSTVSTTQNKKKGGKLVDTTFEIKNETNKKRVRYNLY
jgi:hypothetical protein